jgi:DNA-directed RNA polymerase III subunit RPC2
MARIATGAPSGLPPGPVGASLGRGGPPSAASLLSGGHADDWLGDFWSSLSARELASPVKSLSDKWTLLPAFLKVRGLVKQHIDSYNYFVSTDIKQIMLANQKITADADPNFYLKYLDIRIGSPQAEVEMVSDSITPNDCRLRDMSYCAPILVDIEYTRGKLIVRKKNIKIGRMPIMLRSEKCVLFEKNEAELAALREVSHLRLLLPA